MLWQAGGRSNTQISLTWMVQRMLMHDRLHNEGLDRLEPRPWITEARASVRAPESAVVTAQAPLHDDSNTFVWMQNEQEMCIV